MTSGDDVKVARCFGSQSSEHELYGLRKPTPAISRPQIQRGPSGRYHDSRREETARRVANCLENEQFQETKLEHMKRALVGSDPGTMDSSRRRGLVVRVLGRVNLRDLHDLLCQHARYELKVCMQINHKFIL